LFIALNLKTHYVQTVKIFNTPFHKVLLVLSCEGSWSKTKVD